MMENSNKKVRSASKLEREKSQQIHLLRKWKKPASDDTENYYAWNQPNMTATQCLK